MESALRLHCNTFPFTSLPLRTPSSFHAANPRFSFHRSSFSTGKVSRSYTARPILVPITSAVGPSRHYKANYHRIPFTMACVIGIIGCSFWLKQQVILAPQVEKGSSQMESTDQEGLSKKPEQRPVTEQVVSKLKTNMNPQKPGSEAPVSLPQVVDMVEDLLQSGFAPQQFQSSSSGVSGESLVSEHKEEKHLKPELQRKSSDAKRPGTEQVGAELKTNKNPQKPGSEAPVSLPQVVDMVEDLPQSDFAPQQFRSSSSSVGGESLVSEHKEEKHLKPELQRKSSDVKVNPSTGAPQFSPSQVPQIDSGVGAVTSSNLNSLASPLVPIIFRINPYPMPTLVFVSPPINMPVEPRPKRLKSDREDGRTKVLVRGVPVSPSNAAEVEQIFADHGDITANCLLQDQDFRGNLIEGLVTVMRVMQKQPAGKLNNDDFTIMYRKLEDLERVKMNVGWLRERIETLRPFLNLVEASNKWETMEAEMKRMGARLAEQEAKLAKQEKELAQKHAYEAKSGKQGQMEAEVQRMEARLAEVAAKLANQEQELAQKHAYEAKSGKHGQMEAEVQRMGARLAEVAAKLANQEQELAQKYAYSAKSEKQGMKEAEVEIMGARLAEQEANLANQEKEVAQKNADKPESEKQGMMEAEVEIMGPRLAEQEANLANQEKELAQKNADKAESEKQGTQESEMKDKPAGSWPLYDLGTVLQPIGICCILSVLLLSK